MIEYLVFPMPNKLVKIEASSVNAAINKYRNAIPDMSENELIIVPTSHVHKTSIDLIFSIRECDIKKVK